MARGKRGGGKSTAGGEGGDQAAATAAGAAPDAGVPPAGAQAAAEEEQPRQAAVEDMAVDELRAELSAARAEIARLKGELSARGGPGSLAAARPPQDVQELQEKLQRLRKEQQEADAARDKAWKQLKAVVQEISSLANPDYLQSLQVRAQAD